MKKVLFLFLLVSTLAINPSPALALIAGADSNGDKKVTMNEINEFIGDNVPYMTRKLHDGRQQTPSVKSADMSRFLAEYR